MALKLAAPAPCKFADNVILPHVLKLNFLDVFFFYYAFIIRCLHSALKLSIRQQYGITRNFHSMARKFT